MQAKKRVQSVEIWRLIFAVTIILCHACFLIPWNYGGNTHFRQSTLGVEFFYILSGFLFARGVDMIPNPAEHLGKETWNYVFRRIKKIYPEFLFAVVLNFTVLLVVCNQNPFAKEDWYLYLWDFAFLNCTGLAGLHESAVGGCWYLSGMFLSMAILYPLIRKNKDTFLHIIAPLAAVFLMGWFAITKGKIGQALEFENGICLGLLRALAEMCVGCVCYTVSQKVPVTLSQSRRKRRVSDMVRSILWTLAEIMPLVIVLYINANYSRSNRDFICIGLIAIGTIAAFSGQSLTSKIHLPEKFITWCSRTSFALYLNHYVWGRMFSALNLPIPFRTQLLIYIGLSFLASQVSILTMDALKELPKLFAGKQQKTSDPSINA